MSNNKKTTDTNTTPSTPSATMAGTTICMTEFKHTSGSDDNEMLFATAPFYTRECRSWSFFWKTAAGDQEGDAFYAYTKAEVLEEIDLQVKRNPATRAKEVQSNVRHSNRRTS